MTDIRTVIIDGEEFSVEIETDGDKYLATIDGQTFSFSIPDAKNNAPRKRGSGGKRKRSGTVSASMPGKVVTVEVQVGDKVQEGQTILILEAMKMETEVNAPKSGSVSRVFVNEGDTVEVGDLLFAID